MKINVFVPTTSDKGIGILPSQTSYTVCMSVVFVPIKKKKKKFTIKKEVIPSLPLLLDTNFFP